MKIMHRLRELSRDLNHWMQFSPPGALSSRGWESFSEDFKRTAPIRYLISRIKPVIVWPVKRAAGSAIDYVLYRTVSRCHAIDTGLSPGFRRSHELLLHSSFSILKNYVEKELAQEWRYTKNYTSWLRHFAFALDTIRPRNPSFGIAYMDLCISGSDIGTPDYDDYVHSFSKVKDLYNWWVNERPQRQFVTVPSYDKQGLGLIGACDPSFDATAPDYVASRDAMAINRELKNKWDTEDTEKLKQLLVVYEEFWL